MDRWLRNVAGLFATVVVLCAIGCSGSNEADAKASADQQATRHVGAHEEVTVLARKGDVTLVRTASGATGFVPSDRLQVKANADVGVVTAASELDWQQPTPPTKEEPVPRPVLEIKRARNQVSVLYLSADGSQEFLRPKLVGPFIDPESGQTCWPAYTCTNEGCPGLRAGAGRHAFAGVLRYLTVNPDGTYTLGGNEERHGLVCPACGAKDGLRPYVLPETAEHLQQLAEEHRRRLAWERANR